MFLEECMNIVKERKGSRSTNNNLDISSDDSNEEKCDESDEYNESNKKVDFDEKQIKIKYHDSVF